MRPLFDPISTRYAHCEGRSAVGFVLERIGVPPDTLAQLESVTPFEELETRFNMVFFPVADERREVDKLAASIEEHYERGRMALAMQLLSMLLRSKEEALSAYIPESEYLWLRYEIAKWLERDQIVAKVFPRSTQQNDRNSPHAQ